MLDADGDEMVEKREFFKLQKILSKQDDVRTMAEETERQVRAERPSLSRQSKLQCVSSCVQISVPDTWGSYQELTLSSRWKSKRGTHMSRPARVHE